MIKIAHPLINGEEISAVTRVLRSGKLAQGHYVEKLERQFSELCDTSYGVATNNGTSALHSALYAVGIEPGDEVITTPFTFVATANAILMIGAIPIFVDIDKKTYTIDPFQIEKNITRKTKAIIAVNLYGQPANFAEINTIAKKYKLIVIEDAAQSIGATYKKKMSGNLADIGCFSFYATKNITCGEGGMIVTNNKDYCLRARSFRNHGQNEKKRFFYEDLGYNYRLTDFQAAMLLAQLKKLPSIIARRQKIAQTYTSAFEKTPGLITPFCVDDRTHAYHQYTFSIVSPFKMVRNKLQVYLARRGIESIVYYPKSLHHFKHFDSDQKNSLQSADKAAQTVLSIPVHPNLKKNDIAYIIKTIKNSNDT